MQLQYGSAPHESDAEIKYYGTRNGHPGNWDHSIYLTSTRSAFHSKYVF